VVSVSKNGFKCFEIDVVVLLHTLLSEILIIADNMDPGQDNHVSSSDDIIKDAPVMEKHGEDEDVSLEFECGF